MSVGILNFNFLPDPQWPSDMISRFKDLSHKEQEKISSSIGKGVSSIRCVLNILANSSFLEGTQISGGMSWWAKKAKILSAIGIYFSVCRVKKSLEETTKSVAIDDYEGALVNSLGVASTSADTLYSVSTVTNAFCDIIGRRPFQILADISMPLCFVMSGIDISSRSLQLSKAFKLYQEIDPAIFLKEEATSMNALRRKLQRRFGIRQEAKTLKRLASASQGSSQTLEDRKVAKLDRMAPKKTQEDVNKLFNSLSANKNQPLTDKERKEVASYLQKIRFDLEKKMAEDTILMVAALVGVVSLAFFCMHGMGALPYVVQIVATTIKAYSGVCVENLFDVSPTSLIGKEA